MASCPEPRHEAWLNLVVVNGYAAHGSDGFANQEDQSIQTPSPGGELVAVPGGFMQASLSVPRASFTAPAPIPITAVPTTPGLGFNTANILPYPSPIATSAYLGSSDTPGHSPDAELVAFSHQSFKHVRHIADYNPIGSDIHQSVQPLPGHFWNIQGSNPPGPSNWHPNSTTPFELRPCEYSNVPNQFTPMGQLPYIDLEAHSTIPNADAFAHSHGQWCNPTQPVIFHPVDWAVQHQAMVSGEIAPNQGAYTCNPEIVDVSRSVVEMMPTANNTLNPGCGARISSSSQNSPAQLQYPRVSIANQRHTKVSSAQKEQHFAHRAYLKNAVGPSRGRRHGPLTPEAREEAKETRQMKACVRCHLSKNKCSANEADRRGECVNCSVTATGLSMMSYPCIRFKITDIEQLFRIGPSNGFVRAPRWLKTEWDRPSTWKSQEVTYIPLTQGHGNTSIQVGIKEFRPEEEDSLDRAHGSHQLRYAPYAIASITKTTDELKWLMNRAAKSYVDHYLTGKSKILAKTFNMIFETIEQSKIEGHTKLLKNTLLLWVGSRFIETPWKARSGQVLDPTSPHNMSIPVGTHVPVSMVMDHQLDQIIVKTVLNPLKLAVQKGLQALVVENKRKNWLTVFLCTFLILNNYEAATAHDHSFAKMNNSETRFSDDKLLQHYHHGALVLLVHFRYCCKGHTPFQTSAMVKKRHKDIPFNQKQEKYIGELVKDVSAQEDTWKTLEASNEYDSELHLVSKMFRDDAYSSKIFENLMV